MLQFRQSLGVFVIFKHHFAIFACLCPPLSTSNDFLLSLSVFARLCASLRVFARLCVSLRSLGVSLRYLDRPLTYTHRHCCIGADLI